MTDSDESHTSTRPISVAELLAKNGTIGAPVSGRRRRRRGNSDAVTVAELTGEIPVLKVSSYGPDVADEVADEHSGPVATAEPETVDADAAEQAPPAEAVDATELEDLDVDAEPGDRATVSDHTIVLPSVGAEGMSPDPLAEDDESAVAHDDDDDDDDLLALSGAQPVVKLDEVDDHAPVGKYAELFGGHAESAATADYPAHESAEDSAPQEGTPLTRGAWVVGQSVLAVAFGAGMFFAFDQLWRWNMIVALVLSVLVILGLVVGVRVVRKTDDLSSTLIAVAVGALVTFGPLALLTSH